MIPVSNEYKRELIKGNRNYLIKVDVTLAGHSVPDFTLTNSEIWDGGITLDNAISSDNSFDIGSAIVGSLTVVINNINGDYSQYDFFDAKLTLYLGVIGDIDEFDTQRYYRIGFYVVDVPTYNGSLITLECLDNMVWFDTPYKEVTGITYPATARTVVQAICSHVGVVLGTPTFPNDSLNSTRVMVAPERDLSCREALQYIAQMCCCYCKINTAGELVLRWYDKSLINNIIDYDGGTFSTTTTPYSDGCDLDGGHFNPWDGDSVDGGLFTDLRDRVFISNNYDIQVGTDDVVITGCRVRNNASNDNAFDVLWVDSTVEEDHDRYVLCIDDNPFILTETNASEIANLVGSILAGLPIRGFSSTSLSDFSYETGDMATVVDFRGNRYYTWLTHTTFTTNNSETFSCGVESLKKRSEQRFSTIAETIEKAKVALTAYDTAVKEINALAQNAIGYNEYVYSSGTGKIMYRYNGPSQTIPVGTENPKFPDATVVFKISGEGVFVSTSKDDQGYEQYTNGYDANSGTAILNLLYVQGLNADWITAGNINASVIGVTNLNASNITSGTLNAARIGANSITANKLSVTALEAISTKIGPWTIDSAGFTNGANAWVRPMEISCGQYGGTLVGMRGRASGGGSDGYLEVAGNANDDYIHVRYNGITKKNNGSSQYAVWESSDKRVKKNIKKLSLKEASDLISNVIPKKFELKSESGVRYGFIAQEVREIINDDCAIEYGEDTRAIHYSDFIAPLVKVVQNQQSEIDSLKQELAELKARVK